MADKNLKNINDDYPVLSGYDLLKKLEQTLPRPGMAKGYLPEKSSALQKCLPSLLEERLNTLQEEHVSRNRDLMQADWNPNKRIAYVLKCKGKVLQSAGEMINGRNVLYPEEVLFLMEISALELHFNGAIQSIQEAYRLLLAEEMAVERFQVYSLLKRTGYIVVRHRKRSYDSSQIEHQRQVEPEPVYDDQRQTEPESSGTSAHVTQQISQELQKYSDKNEYYTNDCIDGGKISSKIKNFDDVKLKSKNNQHFRCLWQGIDIPNIAGKAFLDLEIPSLHFFPKNVCPQKIHYIFDLSASKTEAELTFNPEGDYNYDQYYEHNASNSSNIMEYSENQTFLSGSQNYNVGETENLSSNQFKNVSQNVHTINQTEDQSNHNDVQSAELQQLPSDNAYINTQDCVHSIYGNQNHINMQTRTHVPPSAEYSFNIPYSEVGSSHIENYDRVFSHTLDNNRIPSSNYEDSTFSTIHKKHKEQQTSSYEKNNNHFNRTSAQNYENANVISLVNKVGEQLDSKNVNSDYNCLYNSTSDPYGKSQKINRNYSHHNNNSKNKDKNYNDSSKKPLPKEISRKRYINRPLRNHKRNIDGNKRRKGRREEFSEDMPLFPRINKMVASWDEFKHEAELQSTAEYLMNGPAKILWNNYITPLVAPSDHLTKESVFGALSIIKNRNDTESCTSQPPSYGKLDFDVYLPTVNYSRWNPGPPNHRIKVVRCKDPTPTMGYEDKIPVHYAMVDNGTITFYSFSNVNLPSYI